MSQNHLEHFPQKGVQRLVSANPIPPIPLPCARRSSAPGHVQVHAPPQQGMFQKQFLAVSSPPSAVAATANQHPQPLQSSLLSVTLESAGVRPGIMGDAYAAQLCFHRNSGLLGEYFDPLGRRQCTGAHRSAAENCPVGDGLHLGLRGEEAHTQAGACPCLSKRGLSKLPCTKAKSFSVLPG